MVTLEDALRVIASAEERSKLDNPMNIAVADLGGNLRELIVRTLGSGFSSRLR